MRLAAASLLAAATLFAASLAAQTPAPAPAQPRWDWPARMANARVLPADTPPERLRDIMRGFTQALGVRCQFCHVGQEGQPLSTFDFVSDANPRKNVARAMMQMTWRLNRETLPAIPGLSEPRLTCYSCHRGAAEPATAPPEAPAAPAPARPTQ